LTITDVAAIVSMVRDVVLGPAAAVTAVVGVSGLRKWHQEMSGKADFEIPRALGRAALKLQDAINSCRSPFMQSSEFPSGYDLGNSTNTSIANAAAKAHVFNGRWKHVLSALEDFDAQSLEAEALWGADIRLLTQAFRRCVSVLRAANEAIIDDAQAGGAHFANDKSFMQRMRANAFASTDAKDNELSQLINTAVEDIEKKLREKLVRR
jgi:hypothetical protein